MARFLGARAAVARPCEGCLAAVVFSLLLAFAIEPQRSAAYQRLEPQG